MAQIDAVVAGLICLDEIPFFPSQAVFAPGRITEIGAATLVTGGAVANTGLALYRLGMATRLMGKIGDDLFGQAVLEAIRAVEPGLAEGMIVVPGETTSYTIVISPPGVDRMFFHCPGANHSFGADDINYDQVAEARLFHFGYPPFMRRFYAGGGRELVDMFRRAKALGVTTSLDMALPDPAGPSGQVDWPALLAAALPHVDLFMPSADELCLMLDRPRCDTLEEEPLSVAEVQRLATRCLDLGAGMALIKCGVQGLYLRTADAAHLGKMGRAAPADLAAWACRELWSPCFVPEPLVGTTGAGDATIAGFLAALLRGLPVIDASTMACAVGGCNVEAADALSGVRSWEETVRRVQAGWSRAPVSLVLSGWRRAPRGVWIGPEDGRTKI